MERTSSLTSPVFRLLFPVGIINGLGFLSGFRKAKRFLCLIPSFSKANEFILGWHRCCTSGWHLHSWKAPSSHLRTERPEHVLLHTPLSPAWAPEACWWRFGNALLEPTRSPGATALKLSSSPFPAFNPHPRVHVHQEGKEFCLESNVLNRKEKKTSMNCDSGCVTHRWINQWTCLAMDYLPWCSSRN